MSRIAYILALVLIVMQTAGGAELFMSTRERITFADDLTLVVMDVEPQAGVVWLELRDEGVALRSSVLRTGESFAYDERGEGLELKVLRIYAGGERDLVDLEVVSGEVTGRSSPAQPQGSQEGRRRDGGETSLIYGALVALMILILAAWVYFGATSRKR
ncbi:MAG: hypothetical protein METHAR1v1_650003 [Methanothrix sp.]|jgi:hypothetical protein|nr:MAG: hypothetical protein METHAR1v1_650003 [Methanothrix sp.]